MIPKFMNGSQPFTHPSTGVLIAPYQWYEGYAHLEHENEELPLDESIEGEDENLTGGQEDTNPDDLNEGEDENLDPSQDEEPQGEEKPKKRSPKRKKKDDEVGE